MNVWKLLKKKAFRNFLIADVISGFGVGMTTVGANWYLLAQTHSNKLVGFYLTINVLAGFLMAPLAGSLTDRLSRKTVILWSFIGRLIPIALIALYFANFGFNIWVMFLLSIVTGAGWITYMAASRSYVQVVLPKGLLGSANSFIEVSLQVGMFAAGAMSGIILRYTGFLMILLINIAVFLIAVGLVLTIQKDKRPRLKNKDEKTDNSSFTDGLKYIGDHKLILSIGLLSVLPLVVTQLFNVSSPDYVSTILKASSVVYGFADMSYGIGGLVAGLITGFLINKFSDGNLGISLFSLASLVLFALFFGHSIALLYVCTFGLGLSNSALRVTLNTLLMEKVDKSYMGRATSIWNGTAQLINVFASTLIGGLNDYLGANYGFLIMFFIMFLGIVWCFLLKDKLTRKVS